MILEDMFYLQLQRLLSRTRPSFEEMDGNGLRERRGWREREGGREGEEMTA